MASYLAAVSSSGFDLFETTDGWSGKLETEFNAWAATQTDSWFTEHAGNAAMTERLMKDEEAGEQLADFVSSLPAPQFLVAVQGMLGTLKRAEVDDVQLHDALEALTL